MTLGVRTVRRWAGTSLLAAFAEGMFIGERSWSRRPHSGYKVVFAPFRGGKPSALPAEVLTGFLNPDGEAYGRPVGVAHDRTGRCSWPTTSATPSGV